MGGGVSMTSGGRSGGGAGSAVGWVGGTDVVAGGRFDLPPQAPTSMEKSKTVERFRETCEILTDILLVTRFKNPAP